MGPSKSYTFTSSYRNGDFTAGTVARCASALSIENGWLEHAVDWQLSGGGGRGGGDGCGRKFGSDDTMCARANGCDIRLMEGHGGGCGGGGQLSAGGTVPWHSMFSYTVMIPGAMDGCASCTTSYALFCGR
jgi:hypothetical protein